MALVRESDSFDAGPSSLLRTALPFVLNMSASVALIAVNKALMSTYGFVWGARTAACRLSSYARPAVTLCGLHFTTTAVVGRLGKRREEQQAVCIPLPGMRVSPHMHHACLSLLLLQSSHCSLLLQTLLLRR